MLEKIDNWLYNLHMDWICYNNDWGKFDFIRRLLVPIIANAHDWTRNHC